MKHRRITRLLSGMTALLMGASVIRSLPAAVFAADDTGTTGDVFRYSIADGIVTIEGYDTDDRSLITSLTVPETVNGIAVTHIQNGAFSGYTELESLTLPDTVEFIGVGAFDGTALSELKLPENIKEIRAGFIAGCENLKTITIPKGLPIDGLECSGYFGGGWGATFKDCFVEHFILEDGIEYIPAQLTHGDTHFKSIEIPSSVKIIGQSAFEGCELFTEFTVPDTITQIDYAAFYGCPNLTSVKLPEGLEVIGEQAFAKTPLTGIAIPSTVTTMNYAIFSGCESLKEITLPASLTTAKSPLAESFIEEVTFAEGMEKTPEDVCRSMEHLVKVNIPDSVTELGEYFCRDSAIREFTVPKQITAAPNAFLDAALETLNFGDGLTVIPERLAQNTKNLKTIGWTDSVTEISEGAFAYSGIETVEIPDTVTKIGYNAFYDCESLTKLRLPESECDMHSHAFSYSKALKSVYVPAKLYGEDFKNIFNYSGLESITFAPEITEIPEGICCYCDQLKTINWPDAPVTVKQYAFTDCVSLTNVQIPDTVTMVESFAFQGCEGITELHLPTSLNHIGRESFAGLKSLKSLYFPSELTDDDGYWPFRNGGIETLEIAEGVTRITGSFCLMPELRTVIFPESLTEIGSGTFSDCPKLTGVTLPPNIKTLGQGAFNHCYSLTNIHIPASLEAEECWGVFECYADSPGGLEEIWFDEGTEVIPKAFCYGSRLLRTVHLPASLKKIGASAFGQCIRLETVDSPQEDINFLPSSFSDCDSLYDPRINIYDKDGTFINRTVSSVGENGLINYAVYYSVNPRFRSRMTEGKLWITTAKEGLIAEECLPDGIEYNGYEITQSISTNDPEGVFRFSIRTKDTEDPGLEVKFGIKMEGEVSWEHYINKITADGTPVSQLSLNTPAETGIKDGQAVFTVFGYAPPGAEVGISAAVPEDQEPFSTTVTASPYTGKYTCDIASAAESGALISVTAICGEELKAEKTVLVSEGKNDIIKATLEHYNWHQHFKLDITDCFKTGAQPYFGYNPAEPLKFEVTLADNDCACVMISSTVNGKSSGIRLKFDETTGTWKGEGHFGTAIPGTLNVLAFPKNYHEVAQRVKSSKGNNILMINGHPFLGGDSAEQSEYADDTAEMLVKEGKGKLAASDERGYLTTYDFSETMGKPAGAASYYGKASALNIGGEAVTAKDIVKDPAKYGFVASPLEIADEEGNVSTYFVKFLGDDADTEDILSGITVGTEGKPNGITANDGSQTLMQRFFNWMADVGEKPDTPTKFINGTAFVEVPHKIAVGLETDWEGEPNDFVIMATTEPVKGLIGAVADAKGGKFSTANNVAGKAMSWAECGMASCSMMTRLRNITNSDDPYVKENENTMYACAVGHTMLKATNIIVGGALIGESIGAAAVVIAGGAAVLPEVIAVAAVVGVVYGIGKFIDWLGDKLDEQIKDRGKVNADGSVRTIIDPSGIAYEFLPSNPVEGAEAKIWYQDESGKAVLWNAEDYEQQNPLLTDGGGWFAWDVPEGMWKVTLTKDGYSDAESEWLPVLPVQTGVNLNMTSKGAAFMKPPVLNEQGTGILVSFTKHMQDSTVTAESLRLLDADGNPVSCKITPVKEEGNDTDCSMTYLLTPDSACTVSAVSANDAIQTYAGTPFTDGGVGLENVKIEKSASVYGDVNGDGVADGKDAIRILQYYNATEILDEEGDFTPEQIQIADVDLSGDVSPKDATYIQQFYHFKEIMEEPKTWFELIKKDGVPDTYE